MGTRIILSTVMAIASGLLPAAHALTQEELVARLQAAGYSQIRDIKSTAEGTTARAAKNGTDVRLLIDSSGQVKEQK
ncbi:hypothetical protein [Bradyrhizobium sp. LMG 9283]|uniref:hypothetical protein n=1 Tax=Bradyrhizobium sp. LMG 9283 TaxID=592064 RepID=UPI00388F07D2